MPNDVKMSPVGEVDWDRYNRAIELRDSGQVKEALTEIHELAQSASNPDEKAILLANELVCLRLMRRFSDAWVPLREAYELVPKCSPTFVFLGYHEARLLFDELKGKEALRKVESLFTHCGSVFDEPETREDYQSLRALQGILLVELERSAEARPILEEAVSYETDKAWSCYSLGRCYLDLDDLKRAKHWFRQALDALPISRSLKLRTHYQLGMIYFKETSYAWAKQEFESCLPLEESLDPSRKNIYEWLAVTCNALGQRGEAAKYKKLADQE